MKRHTKSQAVYVNARERGMSHEQAFALASASNQRSTMKQFHALRVWASEWDRANS